MQECNHTKRPIQPPPGGPDSPPAAIHALYLHLPFCFHKCHYCDFFSIVEPTGKTSRQDAFTDALIAELIAQAGQYPLRPSTIFVGGGTPTLLRPDLWQRLLDAMKQTGALDSVTEFTVEANPETVTPELMRILAEGGVNRLSMGAQSFNPRELKTLERWHDPDTVPKAMVMARDAGITNLNLDLIFAIPDQTLDALDHDLIAAVALEPTHLSCYSLIFEPNTPLTQKLKLGRISQVGEDLERDMYDHVMTRLDAAGYEHYEISNWAYQGTGNRDQGSGQKLSDNTHDKVRASSPAPRSPTPEPRTLLCQHNLIYWQNKNWLGLGPSAASHVDGKRWKNQPHLGNYIAESPKPPTMDHEQLPPRRQIGEQIMLGLRLREGLTHDWIDNHLPADDPRHQAIDELITIDMLERTDTHLRLTRQGLFLADSVIAKLL